MISIKKLIEESKYKRFPKTESKATDPIKDFIDIELIDVVKDIKEHSKSLPGLKYKNKPREYFRVEQDLVPENYKKWWTKEDLKLLYKGIVNVGFDIESLVVWMNYKFTYKQIKYKIKREEKMRPKLISAAMDMRKPKI